MHSKQIPITCINKISQTALLVISNEKLIINLKRKPLIATSTRFVFPNNRYQPEEVIVAISFLFATINNTRQSLIVISLLLVNMVQCKPSFLLSTIKYVKP